MANYPDSIYEPREKENRNGVEYDPDKKNVLFAEDFQNDDDEIVAIETELGTNPKGAFDSVKDFLTALLAAVIGAFTDIPDVPASYEGEGGKVVKVKATEDGLEFGEAPPPGLHASSHENGGGDEISVAGLSGELADDQPPKPHASSHENGGGDEISVAGLSGELADDQPPKPHASSHENGGGDEISVAGLSGELADDQPPKPHASSHASGGADPLTEADIGAVSSITFIIDGGGAAITTGAKGHLEIPFKCEIQRATLLADQNGSIKVDIWKDTYANFPPTDGDTICGGNEPEISSAQKYQDATLTDWTKTINAGDILAFNVDSCSTITRITIALKVVKTA
jgi:hypothetical protein